MPSLYICLRCRLKLSGTVAQHIQPQWLRRAASSVSTPQPPTSTLVPNSASQFVFRQPREKSSQYQDGFYSDDFVSLEDDPDMEKILAGLGRQALPGQKGRYSGSMIRPQHLEETQSRTSPTSQEPSSGDEVAALYELIMDPSASPAHFWSVFKHQYPDADCAALKNPKLVDAVTSTKNDVFGRLIMRMIGAWTNLDTPRSLPKPTEVVSHLHRIKMMRPELWSRAIWVLIGRLVRPRRQEGEESEILRTRWMDELMLLWRRCLDRFGHEGGPSTENSDFKESGNIDWSLLPDAAALSPITSSQSGLNYRERFYHFIPLYPSAMPRTWDLSAAALLTFDLLAQGHGSTAPPGDEYAHHQPFALFIARLLLGPGLTSEVNRARAVLEAQKLPSARIDAITDSLRDALNKAKFMIGSVSESDYRFRSVTTPSSRGENLEAYIRKRLTRATASQNVRSAEALWADAQRGFSKLNSSKVGIPLSVYHLFLDAFNTMRRPNQAIQIWNAMVANGINPTVKTYTAMMTGCQKARDADSLETLWRKMLTSGLQPDDIAWAVRIRTLMSSKQPSLGLLAIDEMTRMSKAGDSRQATGSTTSRKAPVRVEKSTTTGPPPTVRILNAALASVAETKKYGLVKRLFSWARNVGIKSDLITYNIMIGMALDGGNTQEAMKLMVQMKQAGIDPDIVTVTKIVYSLFKNAALSHLSAEELPKQVLTILDEIESWGLQVNSQLYTVIIGGLIEHHGNLAAVQAVLNHMGERNFRPSPQVLSVLLSYHTAQEPPDISAIDTLWEQMNTCGVIDLFLYDRMIQAYGRFRQVGKTMMLLSRMSREGKAPSWHSLEAVVEALAATGQWGRFHELLADIRAGEGLIRHGLRGWSHDGDKRFWMLVERLQQSQPPSEDIMARREGIHESSLRDTDYSGISTMER